MRTTLDIEGDAYRLAKAVASQKGVSMGKAVAEAIAAYYGASQPVKTEVSESVAGFPTLTVGHSITAEDVAALEDE